MLFRTYRLLIQRLSAKCFKPVKQGCPASRQLPQWLSAEWFKTRRAESVDSYTASGRSLIATRRREVCALYCPLLWKNDSVNFFKLSTTTLFGPTPIVQRNLHRIGEVAHPVVTICSHVAPNNCNSCPNLTETFFTCCPSRIKSRIGWDLKRTDSSSIEPWVLQCHVSILSENQRALSQSGQKKFT